MPTTTGKATEFITFSRASNATVVDADGKIKWAPHNLLTNSESFDAAAWTKGNLNTTGTPAWVNVVAAPNGTLTADRFIEDTTNSSHGISQGSTVAANVAITVGAFVKANGRNIVITAYTASHGLRATFNLSTLAITNGSYGSSTYTGAEIVDVGNGWYRVSVSGIASSTEANPTIGINTANGTTLSYTGDGSSGFYLWGAHLYRSDLGGMQANTSAYPMYNHTTPKNLLGYTENFSNAAWITASSGGAAVGVKTPNYGVAPDGSVTATRIQLDVSAGTGSSSSQVYQSFSATNLSPYMRSAWVKTNDGSTKTIMGFASAGATPNTLTVTGEWTRFSAVRSATSTVEYFQIILVKGTTSDTADLLVWHPQVSDSASLDSYVPVYGAAVTSAAYYGPRRDFDPVTLACKGLLVEEQRTNLLLNSATLSTQNVTTTAVAHTLSFYGTGTVTLSGTSTAGPLVGTGAANRVTLTFTPTAGTLTLTVTGSVTQAQLEAGSFATSYIPTGAATATRSVDVASVSTQAFPHSESNGTWVAAFQTQYSGTAPSTAHLINYDGSGSKRVLYFGAGSDAIGSFDGTTILNATGDVTGSVAKSASAYTAAERAVVSNGGTVTTGSTVAGYSSASIAYLGSNSSVSLNGWVRQITYIPRRLSNSELQTRTA